MPTKNALVTLREKITAYEGELKTALQGAVPSDKFVRTVLTTISLNPNIAEASTNSILGVCLKAAADGLLLDGREAAIVIYRGKQGPQAKYMPMVYGIFKKVRQSGEISIFNSFLVYENDDFSITYGMEPTVNHTPSFKGKRGDVIGCYAICKFKNGDSDLEWMTVDEIEAVRARSKAKNTGPWHTDWGEMARKTVIRRMSKRLPMGDATAMVERIDELYDLGKDDDYTAPSSKERGMGAAALNDGDDDVIEGEYEEESAPESDPAPSPESAPKETPAQKKARLAKEKANEAAAEAEALAADAADDAAASEGDEESEDVI